MFSYSANYKIDQTFKITSGIQFDSLLFFLLKLLRFPILLKTRRKEYVYIMPMKSCSIVLVILNNKYSFASCFQDFIKIPHGHNKTI